MSRSSACRRWTTASIAISFGAPSLSTLPFSEHETDSSRPHRSHRHIDAVELCFHSFLEDIEKTRPRYPEERTRSTVSPVPTSPQPEQLTSVDEGEEESEARDTRVVREESPLHEAAHAMGRKRSSAPDDGEVRKEVEVIRTEEGY
jgi:hypothetical protein